MITTIKELLAQKGDASVHTIAPDELVVAALNLMARRNIGALLVVDHAERIVGMLTERDYSRKVILEGRSSTNTTVREIMDREVLYLVPEDHVDDAMAIMTEKRLRHLPVLLEGKLVGLISMGDVVKATISHREFLIDQLTRYIVGSYTANLVKFPSKVVNSDERLIASNEVS